MKKYIIVSLLVIIVAIAGLAVQHYCYRLPTDDELRRFHEAKQTTRVESLEGEKVVKDGEEMMHFRVKHSNNSGFSEVYNVEAPKRWVMPWEDYHWMLNK